MEFLGKLRKKKQQDQYNNTEMDYNYFFIYNDFFVPKKGNGNSAAHE